MTKEKIIQIIYKEGDTNPTILTNKGRILGIIRSGKTIHYPQENGSGYDFPEYIYKDLTPDLTKI